MVGVFLGTILIWPTNDSSSIPKGFMLCDGSILDVAQYQALYMLIGNQFCQRCKRRRRLEQHQRPS